MRFLGGGVGHQHARSSCIEEVLARMNEDDDDDMADAAAGAPSPATVGGSEDQRAAHPESTSQDLAEVIPEEDEEEDEDEELDFGYVSDSSEDEHTAGLAEGDGEWEDDPDEGDIAALEGYAEL